MKEFFERATALREDIIKKNDILKNLKLDILSQIVGQVFCLQKLPFNIEIQSRSAGASTVAEELLHAMGYEYKIHLDKKNFYFQPTWQVILKPR